MIQKNFQHRHDFEKALVKGKIGEDIVRRYLEEKGYVVYKPVTEGAHAFDILAVKDKKTVIMADVKAKARRNYFPDTGINYKHYVEYKAISEKHCLPVFLFFVDEMIGQVYGNMLDELEKPCVVAHNNRIIEYPLMHKGIIYFPLSKMIFLGQLTEYERMQLKGVSQRSYAYAYE